MEHLKVKKRWVDVYGVKRKLFTNRTFPRKLIQNDDIFILKITRYENGCFGFEWRPFLKHSFEQNFFKLFI